MGGGVESGADVAADFAGARGEPRRRVIERLGVDGGRVEFVELQPRDGYLRTYYRIDVCLETVPYNGHTTSLDAMWMGVPVVTLVGKTVVGRGVEPVEQSETGGIDRADRGGVCANRH